MNRQREPGNGHDVLKALQEALNSLPSFRFGEREDPVKLVTDLIQQATQKVKPTELCGILTQDKFDQLFRYVAENLTGANPSLTNCLKELLKNVLSSRQKLYPSESYEPWVRYILSFPVTSKSVYHVLEPLAKYVPGSYEWGLTAEWYKASFGLMDTLQHANPVAKCLASLLRLKKGTDVELWVDSWKQYVYDSFSTESRENILTFFLPTILRQQPEGFHYFYRNIPHISIEDKAGCLRVAQKLEVKNTSYFDDSLVDCLHSANKTLRFEALALLLASRQLTEPVPHKVYSLLKANASALFCEAEPKFRNRVLGVMRVFVFRMRASAYALVRDNKSEDQPEQVQEARSFSLWFRDYLVALLKPGNPYRCLVTGCQYLVLLVKSGIDSRVDKTYLDETVVRFPFTVDIYDDIVVRDLINLAPNEYQDVRSTSADLLFWAPSPVKYLGTPAELDVIAHKCMSLLAGARARQADGGARVALLVFNCYNTTNQQDFLKRLVSAINDGLMMARQNLAGASRERGIHGYFQALALICEELDLNDQKYWALIGDMLDCVFETWDRVKTVVTNSAPEGNNPIDLGEDTDATGSEGTLTGTNGQSILSYAWRAISESVNLLHVLLRRYDDFSESELLATGDLLVTQLTTIRHRGAFSAVAPVLQACCAKCYATPDLADCPMIWLDQNLEAMNTRTQLITRRSAGLPFLVTSIVSAHPEPQDAVVADVFGKLLEVARSPQPDVDKENKLDLPQVHAFNCIKALLWDTQLRKATAPQLEPCLLLAISAFTNRSWSIRNCGVMLFSVVHNRLFGVNKGRLSAQVFFSCFKSVRSAILDNLNDNIRVGLSNISLESVYPGLSLLSRLQAIGDYDGLRDFIAPVTRLLGSQVWKLRELAAHVLASIVQVSQTEIEAVKILNSAFASNQNHLHGSLMALNAMSFSPDSRDALIMRMHEKEDNFYNENACCETKIEFVKLYRKLGMSRELKWPTALPGLNPSARVLKSLLILMDIEKSQKFDIDLLGHTEPEVQAQVLRTLGERPGAVSSNILEKVYNFLLKTSYMDIKVKRLCLDLLDAAGPLPVSGGGFEAFASLVKKNEPNTVREKALKCLGTAAANGDLQQQGVWLSLVHDFAHNEDIASSRLCAAESMGRLFRHRHGELAPYIQSSLYLELYWLLMDDDEQIREKSSELVSEILMIPESCSRYCEAKLVALINPHTLSEKLMGPAPLDKQVQDAIHIDDALFVMEKPNLYRNDLDVILQLASCAIIDNARPGLQAAHKLLSDEDVHSPLGLSGSPAVQEIQLRLSQLSH